MVQPTDKRLVTEAKLIEDQNVQDGRLALLENAAGFTAPPLGFEDEVVAPLVQEGTATDDALGARYLRLAESAPIPARFGVVGDGVADDTIGLQAWIDGGGSTLPEGTYRITGTLILNQPGAALRTGPGARILAGAANMTMIRATADGCIISAHLDGADIAGAGAEATGADPEISGCVIENFESATTTCFGVGVRNSGRGGRVHHNTIRNIYAPGDGNTGNNWGPSRAVWVDSNQAATAPTLIEDNIITDISGEEGDAIQVMFFDGLDNTHFLPSATLVSRNIITNASRRYIKIQASDVRVRDNEMLWTWTTPTSHPSTSLSVINSDNVIVERNLIAENLLQNGIQVSGVSTRRATGIQIRNNNITLPASGTTRLSINLDYTSGTIVEGNTYRGGLHGIIVANSDTALVTGNTSFGGAAGSSTYAVWAYNNSTRAAILRNRNMNPARTNPYVNQSVGGVTLDNWSMPAAA